MCLRLSPHLCLLLRAAARKPERPGGRDHHAKPLALAGGGRGGRPPWAEPRHRLDAGCRLGRAFAQPGATAAGPGADRGRARRVGRAGGWRSGIRHDSGSLLVASPGGWAIRRRRDPSPVWPPTQGGARAGGARRADALVLHDVHRARRRLDVGAGADSALCRGCIGTRDERIGPAGAGDHGARRAYSSDACRHRPHRQRGMPRTECLLLFGHKATKL